MSATNRGTKRKPYDFYATPIAVVDNFLSNYTLPQGNILEPSAGNGNIIKALRDNDIYNHITAIEIRAEERQHLSSLSDEVIITDFMKFKKDKEYNVIIGNPPYTLAKEFINKCFEIANENTVIIMLLRTAFLESKGRFEFWQKHPLSDLYVLSKRPSFTGKGIDATSYAWFVWDNRTTQQHIKVI